MFFVCHPKRPQEKPENNAYAKFGDGRQRASWYVMVFSVVVNSLSIFQLCIISIKYLICISILSKLLGLSRFKPPETVYSGRSLGAESKDNVCSLSSV